MIEVVIKILHIICYIVCCIRSRNIGTYSISVSQSCFSRIPEPVSYTHLDVYKRQRDFYYMKRLHQTGNIAQEQLVLILRKLMEVYRMKGEKPEIIVSLSDLDVYKRQRWHIRLSGWKMSIITVSILFPVTVMSC